MLAKHITNELHTVPYLICKVYIDARVGQQVLHGVRGTFKSSQIQSSPTTLVYK
jgi:hypothetical protein